MNSVADNVKYECKYKLQVVNHQGHDYLDIVDLQMTSHSDDGALEIESTDPANQLTGKYKKNLLLNDFSKELILLHINTLFYLRNLRKLNLLYRITIKFNIIEKETI